MGEQLWFTQVLNHLLAAPVTAGLRALGFHVAAPAAPISNYNAMVILVALILAVFATWLGRRLSVERPRAWQQTVEVSWLGLEAHSEDVIGHGGGRFINYLFTLALFILIGNLLGLIPGFESPTGSIAVTVGLALTAFVYYHVHGLRHHGTARYAKTFLGPVKAISPLMVVVETISHFARILSLSVRLFANMYAGELITAIFIALVPVAGVIFMGLHVFVALLQTYIFVVLTMIYLSGAVMEEH